VVGDDKLSTTQFPDGWQCRDNVTAVATMHKCSLAHENY